MSEIATDRLPTEYAIQAKYIRLFLIGLMLQLVLRIAWALAPQHRTVSCIAMQRCSQGR